MVSSDHFYSDIDKHLKNDLPFVVYRKPNENVVKAMLQNDEEVYTTQDFTQRGFVFSPFDDNETSVLIPLEASEFLICNTENSLMSLMSSTRGGAVVQSETKEKHIQLVQKGVEAIHKKVFQKVVLSRCEKVTLRENNPIQIFKRLLSRYVTAFVYCWYHPKVGLWLGATPETLLKVEGNRFSTMALAGTQKFKGTLNVEWSDKEKEEQQIVTDFIVDTLKDLVETITVSDVQTVKAGDLLHLQTKISGISNPKMHKLKEVFSALHPTPAVCGMPKIPAKQFIRDNESYTREFYTGFLGELNLQEKRTRNNNKRNVENNAYTIIKTVSNLFVNLRCMQLTNNKALVYVGGGITKDSIPEHEWVETINKAQTIRQVLD